MRHLAALEAQAGLDLVAVAEEADSLVLLGLVVVLVDGDRELDLLDDNDLLLLARCAVALVLLVEVLTVVLDLADGRNGVGRDLDQVERLLAGTPSCSPSSSMTRTSRARIRSLVRIKDLAERLSNGGIFSLHGSQSLRPCFQGIVLFSAVSRQKLMYSRV
jgi:hypothetical protein